MDWQTGMNRAIDYLESCLETEADLKTAAMYAGTSVWEFQRMFSFITGLSVGNYMRRRRMSQAAGELLGSSEKVIDIAMKYGYDSAAAFSRAFSQVFGLPPSAVRSEGAKLELYPKLIFNNIEEGRVSTMDKYSNRGYYVTNNMPVYLTNDMDKSCKWFRDVLGWYGDTCAKNEAGEGVYGCVFDYPGEIFDTVVPQRGFYMFKGNPNQDIVGFMAVTGIDKLREHVLQNGWTQISEITLQSWGARQCRVTTIDGSVLLFHDKP